MTKTALTTAQTATALEPARICLPRNTVLARNLGQLRQSLPRHHYGSFMTDNTNKNYKHSPNYEKAVKRWAPFTGTNYELGVTISGRDEMGRLRVNSANALVRLRVVISIISI